MLLIFLIIYLILNNTQITFPYVLLPIETYQNQSPNESDWNTDIFSNYFIQNIIYTYLTIGQPSQNIKALLNFDSFVFSIYNKICKIPSDFDIEKSKTYKYKPNGYVLTDIYVDTYIVYDCFEFYINGKIKKKFNNFQYLFAPTNKTGDLRVVHTNFTCAEIGFKLPEIGFKSNEYNFILMLKKLKIISNYDFFIIITIITIITT